MPTGLYRRWQYDSETKRFTTRQNKSRSFENMVPSYFQRSRPDCKIETNVTTGRQKKIDFFSVDGICYHFNTLFEAMGYFHYCPRQEARPSLNDNKNMRRIRKRGRNRVREDYFQHKGYDTKFLKSGSAIVGIFTKLMHQSKVIVGQISPIMVLQRRTTLARNYR